MSFIDDIVGIEEEKRHDEVVDNVVKRLTEIDLYVKPEKCKWKIRKVEFLEVVIKLVLQISFSLYIHNQWTNFQKISCARKPQIRAIWIYTGYI